MANAPIEYTTRQGDDGKWRIDTAQQKGTVIHHGVLDETFDTDEAASARISELKAE
ncbi:MAG TPA: hypothetical protein VKQ27_17825 [Acetobacteraceae bacterium]|nr:hypothetical protein [Acetobacteraceae bacterium]